MKSKRWPRPLWRAADLVPSLIIQDHRKAFVILPSQSGIDRQTHRSIPKLLVIPGARTSGRFSVAR